MILLSSKSIPDAFQNSYYVGSSIQNILYGEFQVPDMFHGMIALTRPFVQALNWSSTLRPWVSC